MSAQNMAGPVRRRWLPTLAAAAIVSLAGAATVEPGEVGRVVFTRAGDVWSADPDGTDPRRLTSGPADDRWPRWSPEGTRIAVVRNGDLVLLTADGALLRTLTTHGAVVAGPSWSPDGLKVAYVRGSDGIAIVNATQEGSNGTLLEIGAVVSVAWNPLDAGLIGYTDGGAVFTVRPDGSDAGVELVPPDPGGRTREDLAWDPQSSDVVFTSTGVDGARIEGAGVSLAGADGDDRSPAWSRDGTSLFFTRGSALHVYRRMPVPGAEDVRSLGVDGDTADAQPLLVASAAVYESGTVTQLFFRVRPLGTGPTTVSYATVAGAGSAVPGTDYLAHEGEVTTPDAFDVAAAIPIVVVGDLEPEEDETFFVDFTFPSDPAAPLRVRGTILNDDGGRNGVVTCTAGQSVVALDPVLGASSPIVSSAGSAVFSPGGERLAYLRVEGGPVELVVADPGGVPLATFPLSGPIDDEIAWSPDGARLAWTVGSTLWVADPASPASAASIASDAVTPAWSADAGPGPRRLAFARVGTGMVCTVRDDGSGEACFTAGYQPRWSPDNATIAFLRGNASVFLINPDGTNERLAASATGTVGSAPMLRWSPRSGSFAFMTASALFVGQEGTPAASVAAVPSPLSAFDWSPDGRQLVVQGTGAAGDSQLWIVGPDDAGVPFAAVRQVTAGDGVVEPRWSAAAVRPTATLVPRGGIERFQQARVEVHLDGPSPDTVQVAWDTVDTGSATPGADFTPGAGTVTLLPGETTGAILVPLLDDAAAEGPESFDVMLTGATGARLGADTQVAVFITDDDNAPVAAADVAATAVDTPVEIPVLANDTDPDGDPVSLDAVGVPAHGSATFNGGLVTYTPAPAFQGLDHFLYVVSDGNGHTGAGLVSVYVGDPPPPPPVLTVTPAFLDFGTVPLNKTRDLVVTVTNNTAQPVALAETFLLSQGPPHPFDVSDFEGCRALSARELEPGESCTQKVRFWSVPDAGAASPATVRLLDGVTFETLATIALFARTGPPDTGPNLPPVAVDDLAGVAPGFNHTLDAIRNDSDPDHDLLRITAVSDPPHGTTQVVPCISFPQNPNVDCVRYVADAGYTGIDAFTYAVSDGRGGHATATFHLAVGTVVPQIAAVTPSSGPTTGGQAIRITGSGFVHGSYVDLFCPSGTMPLDVTQSSDTEILATTRPAPAGVCALRVATRLGQMGQLANAYTYTDVEPPAPTTTTLTTSGSPSVAGQSVTFTAVVTSSEAGSTPVGEVQFVAAGSTLGFGVLNATGSAQISTTVLPVGTHTIEAFYLPTDHHDFSNGSVVQVVNARPTTTTVQASRNPSQAGQPVAFTATVVPLEGGGPVPQGTVRFDTTLGVALGTAALDELGNAVVTVGSLTVGHHTIIASYLPAGGQPYAGSTNSLIQVVEQNLPPVAGDDGPYSLLQGQTLHVPAPGVLANDSDPDSESVTLRVTVLPAHGNVALYPTGAFDYTPEPGYAGPDTFTYVVNDGLSDSNPATVSFVVLPLVVPVEITETILVTDAATVELPVTVDVTETVHVSDDVFLKTSPYASNGTASTSENTAVLVAPSATDASGEPYTITIVSGPAHGTVFPPPGVVMPSGTLVTYTPATGYFGADAFTFQATNSVGVSNVATISIAVQPAPGHEIITGFVPPGGTLTTDTEGDGATPEDVIETAVLTPPGGQVTIEEVLAPPPLPTAFTFLAPRVHIGAPPATAGQPLVLTFLLEAGALPAGATAATLAVFRNGVEVPPCAPGAQGAAPDPCVASRLAVEGDVRLGVRTSAASVWTFGVARSTSGLASGALRPQAGGNAVFAATRVRGQLVGALSYSKGSERYVALRLSAFAVEGGGHTAWFAGWGVDGRTFVAYVEDRGPTGDIFRLWIGGVEKTGDGRLAAGRVEVTP